MRVAYHAYSLSDTFQLQVDSELFLTPLPLLLPSPTTSTRLPHLRSITHPTFPIPRPLLVHHYLLMLFFSSYCTCISFSNLYLCYPAIMILNV